jgi:ubiquinone/menaquinone biosynthesis C-methylase UbiE
MSSTSPKIKATARPSSSADAPLMSPEIYALLDAVPDTYWRYVARHELFSNLWQRHRQPRPIDRVLDVGCGSGGLLAYLAKHNTITPIGVDLFSGTLPYCLQRGINGVSVADATTLPFQADLFDLVIAQDVVEHIEDDQRAISEIYRVCTPGGLALILVPAFRFLWSARDIDLHHYRRYTLSQLTQRMQAVGFNIVHRTYTDLFLLPMLYAAIATAPRTPDGLAALDTANPPGKSGLANKGLLAISRLEATYAKYATLPFGVSAVVLARKPVSSTVF